MQKTVITGQGLGLYPAIRVLPVSMLREDPKRFGQSIPEMLPIERFSFFQGTILLDESSENVFDAVFLFLWDGFTEEAAAQALEAHGHFDVADLCFGSQQGVDTLIER